MDRLLTISSIIAATFFASNNQSFAQGYRYQWLGGTCYMVGTDGVPGSEVANIYCQTRVGSRYVFRGGQCLEVTLDGSQVIEVKEDVYCGPKVRW